MSKYYRGKRTKNIFSPNDLSPFKISRSKLELFLSCSRCFYLDRRLGIGRPPGFPFNINSAVDTLLKKEFDSYRTKKESHPLMVKNGLNALPYAHVDLENWRNSLHKGIQYHHAKTNFIFSGGVDDIWIDSAGDLIVVDYKATSKKEEVTLDADWQISYKRQMEMYQWLFRKNDFRVSDIGYFVYCNADSSKDFFNSMLEFDIKLIAYTGSDSWVEGTLIKAKDCLVSDNIPEASDDCDFCLYASEIKKLDTFGAVK